MLLIPTCSEDATVDLMMPFLDDIDVFRFNINNWRDYKWDFSSQGIRVVSPDGKVLTENNLKCVYLRKPIFFNAIDVPADGCIENWCRMEIERAWQDIYYRMCLENKVALVHPAKTKFYKPLQMSIAKKYFEVPEWHIVCGEIPDAVKSGHWVAKTLTQEKIGQNKVLFVKETDTSKLNPSFPWFLQRKVEAQKDVTALFVNGKIFPFELDRNTFKGDDYRKTQPYDQSMKWNPVEFTQDECESVRKFMSEAGLDFGRFDFLRKDGKLVFLELNPNGQWAWLDIENKYGILKFVCDEIIAKYKSCE